MKASTLEVFEIVKRLIKNEADAKTLIHYWEDANESEIVRTVERKIEHLATKQELAEKIAGLESRLTWKLFAFFVGQCVFLFTILKFML